MSERQERPSALRADDAEIAVLGAALADPAFAMPVAADSLTAQEFAVPKHAVTYRAMERLWNGDMSIDPITLTDAIAQDAAMAATFGGDRGKVMDWCVWLIDAVPTAANVRHHAKLVGEAATRRRVAAEAERLMACARDGSIALKESVQQTFANLLPLASDAERGGFRPLDPGTTILAMEERGRNPNAVVRTGYRCIDDEFHGWREGELYIIGGGAKSGKTTAALNVALNVAEQRHGVGFVECEMTRDALTERFLNNMARVAVGSTSRGRFAQDETDRLVSAARRLKALPIEVDDTALPSLDDVSYRVMELKARRPEVKLVVVDFLQLLTADVRKTTAETLTHISYGLAGLAKRARVALVAPCQTNHKKVDSEQREPELYDLQGSSGMAQAATGVFLCWREERPAGPFGGGDTFWLKCAASRRTPLFRAALQWQGKYMSIAEQSRVVDDRPTYGGQA